MKLAPRETRPTAPTPAEVDEIVAITDPVLRNLRITEAYHRLAMAFPGPRPGANWCAFAVWASKQAGQTIRGEDLLRALERALGEGRTLASIAGGVVRLALRNALAHPGTRRWRVVKVLGQEAFDRAADALARGNRKVFGEIGREFARFLQICGMIPIPETELSRFLSAVPVGGEPSRADYLHRAFRHLAQALETEDHGARAELMLLSNLEIAYFEQARVQPEILAALEAPYTSTRQLGRALLAAISPGAADWPPLVRTPLAFAVGLGGRVAEAALRSLLRRLITEELITLTLPGEVLRLGRNLAGEPPACLRNPRNPELRDLLALLAPPPDDLDGSGADDWSRLEDRMITIGRFFLLRHEEPKLYEPPFTEAQLRELRAGRIPGGVL
ncbi:MAG TPA: hypothetical protein VF167_17900 [Longimicrobiaceae bacterium]